MKTILSFYKDDERINDFFRLSSLLKGREDIELINKINSVEIIDHNRKEKLIINAGYQLNNGFRRSDLRDMSMRVVNQLTSLVEDLEVEEVNLDAILMPTAIEVDNQFYNVFYNSQGNRCVYDGKEIKILSIK